MSAYVDEWREKCAFDAKPLAEQDGSASRDHQYHLFADVRAERVVTFAFPRHVHTMRAIEMAAALLGDGWRYLQADGADYEG